MLEITLLRHWPTSWNKAKKLQGLRDIPLLDSSIFALSQLSVPPHWHSLRWYSSPLQRACQTATALALDAEPQQALIEMDWGEWEGETVSGLRQRLGNEMDRIEQQGLLMRPEGGECPAEVIERLSLWAEQQLNSNNLQLGAVCHKGIIRALMASATGWDMLGKPPVKLDFSCGQRFGWDGKHWHLLESNIPLLTKT